MNMQPTPTWRESMSRMAKIAAVIAVVAAAALMVMSIVVSNDALSRGDGNMAGGASDGLARCGMSQQAFTELPGRLQRDLAETCNRPSDVRP